VLKKGLWLILITLIPGVELRGSIPAGMLLMRDPMPWYMVAAFCLIPNIILGILFFSLLQFIIPLVNRIGPVGRFYARYVERIQRKFNRSIEKHGKWALALFIGIPFPGTGVISGAVAAHIFGMKFMRFVWSSIAGVLIAGSIVMGICMAGGQTVKFARRMHLLPANERPVVQQDDQR